LLDKDIYIDSIVTSEPFLIQNILNTTMVYDYHIGIDGLKQLPLHLLIVPSAFGGDTQIFSTNFKQQFYPFVEYGMAYNIWAESYAIGKWMFLILIILLFVLILIVFNYITLIRDRHLKALFYLMSMYWAFYIHRNSIETIITFQRHYVYIYIY